MTETVLICPLCRLTVDKVLYRYHLEGEREVIARIRQTYPEWTENDGACGRCIDYYHTSVVLEQRTLPEVGPYFPVRSADDFIILPTPIRMDADPRFTGKGITICFIDSGFFPHPDLTMHSKRIKTIVDITRPDRTLEYFSNPQISSWHGTMTTVVCSGDGCLSNGLYKGIASSSSLVLLKVQNDDGSIPGINIIKALEWIDEHHHEFGIRIVNISLGDQDFASYDESEIDRLTERLIDKNIVVVAAAGNDDEGLLKPPANSPRVITVGGIDDENKLTNAQKLYHSTYSKIIEEFMKPELTAPAIWIAAPILPGSNEQKEAETLYNLLKCSDDDLFSHQEQIVQFTDAETIRSCNCNAIRGTIHDLLQKRKYISSHYLHADGTSFAAPLVSSVVAQLLEINPSLDPRSVREILFSTAKRITGLQTERQGFGTVQPRKAVLKALKAAPLSTAVTPFVNKRDNLISFHLNHECASQVVLGGSFNNWSTYELQMEAGRNGVWTIQLPMLPAGKYGYKFYIDDRVWIEDFNNPYREPDGFNGFNSLLFITN